MVKKILLVIIILVIIISGFIFYKTMKNKKENEYEYDEKYVISSGQKDTSENFKFVTDDCISEWDDYVSSIQEDLKETNNFLNDENKKYILKAEENIIKVYYVNEKQEEVLYRVTDISTKFLEKEDIERLNFGIEVKGIQAVNELLEDFE